MIKPTWLRYVFIILLIMAAGIFYSCKIQRDDPVLIELENTQEGISRAIERVIDSVDMQTTDNADITIESKDVINTKDNTGLDALEDSIYVYLCGEVSNPDVYEVSSDTRLVEVIKLAGGLTTEAAAEYVNLASLLSDGQQVYIPSKSEVKEKAFIDTLDTYGVKENSTLGEALPKDSKKLNINTATKEELMTLKGIGSAKAESILEYRKNQGPFKSVEDIKKIKGIKGSVFDKISSDISVN